MKNFERNQIREGAFICRIFLIKYTYSDDDNRKIKILISSTCSRFYALMDSSSDTPPTIFEEFCQLVLDLDESIRFVGIATLSGAVLAMKYRTNLVPLLTREETSSSIKHSVWRMESRRALEEKLGKTLYVVATYEKLKRATIPVGQDGQSLLIISFDNDSDAESIIRNKILTTIKPYGTISRQQS